MKPIKLSAALIVRNEASEIEECLSSLRGFDEIVVCDTGSVDDTLERIQRWSERNQLVSIVPSFEWCDDFSAARNHVARFCDGDWVLHIDADMRLLTDPAAVRQELTRIPGRTASVTQISTSGQRNRRTLLHRPGVQWCGAIHEALEQEGELVPVELQYGWSASHHHDPDRNLRILRREVAADPSSARLAYYLGVELFDRGQLEEAALWFRHCVERCGFRAEKADAHLYLAKIMWRLQRGDEARQFCLESLLGVPDCREALLLMAEMSWDSEARVWRTFAEVARNQGVLFARA